MYYVNRIGDDRFQWSHRYFSGTVWKENIAAGNGGYAFTLANRTGEFALAELKIGDELDFVEYHQKLFDANRLPTCYSVVRKTASWLH